MRKALIIKISLFVVICMMLIGCNFFYKREGKTDGDESFDGKMQEQLGEQLKQDKDKVYIDADPQSTEVTITLYYKHEIADFLVPEQRKVQKDKQSLEQLVVEELLKGPQAFGKLMVMPP